MGYIVRLLLLLIPPIINYKQMAISVLWLGYIGDDFVCRCMDT